MTKIIVNPTQVRDHQSHPVSHSGLGEGVTFPAVMVILSKWTPPSERSRMTSFNFAGIMFGTVVSLSVTGALCEES